MNEQGSVTKIGGIEFDYKPLLKITVDKPESAPSNVITEDTQSGITDISSFIPAGWHILEKYDEKPAIAEGDLNNDGIVDKAFIIEESIKEEGSTTYELDSPRNLLIVFGHKNNAYTLSIKAEKAILLGGEGDGFGDPFDDIKADRGSILLKFFGGGYPRWYMNYRFRYQNNGWYLIGATEGSYVAINGELNNVEEDYNLLIGDYISRKLVDGKIITTKGNRGKRKLVNLQDFVISPENKSQF